MLPQGRIDYARMLFDVLDELTFRLWEIPGLEELAVTDPPKVTVTIEQIGTEHSFDMGFVRNADVVEKRRGTAKHLVIFQPGNRPPDQRTDTGRKSF